MSPRAVVIGPYPPTPDPQGDRTLAIVKDLHRQGFEVVVVSPEPSAAAVCARPDTRAGRRRIARLVETADRVVSVPASAEPGPAEPTAPGVGARLTRLRAGAPTFVRAAVAGVRRLSRRAARG